MLNFFSKKVSPPSTNWLNEAISDFGKFAEEVQPKLIALNQKWFKKDTGFRLVNGRSDKLSFVTDIEGLGEIPEFFFKAFREQLLRIYFNRPTSEVLEFLDEMKKDILEASIIPTKNQ